MNRKRIGLAAIIGLAVATASLVALADPPYQNLEPKPRDLQQPGCTCPHNYQPVKCVAPPDETVYVFSNACFAGCAGFTASQCSPQELRP